ncbi:hypothetical protein ma792 [Moumouvirus australiensis]|uniref:Uncharacterized protein n=1 Tax=Moumouvirus australiensis TaxID=2109587 RepID=A0A2P1EMT5_9VIRU|nr:hypothetical protein QKC55_gp112 [Moumouvirus australiensis]AVL95179.1 hypothetical protein ma792 [Moumouvirus australiensis]
MLYTIICAYIGAIIAKNIARLNGADMRTDGLTTGFLSTMAGGFLGAGFGLSLGIILFAKGSYFWFI